MLGPQTYGSNGLSPKILFLFFFFLVIPLFLPSGMFFSIANRRGGRYAHPDGDTHRRRLTMPNVQVFFLFPPFLSFSFRGQQYTHMDLLRYPAYRPIGWLSLAVALRRASIEPNLTQLCKI